MYPSDHFFLKALFLRGVRRRAPAFGGLRRAADQGYMDKGTGASWAGFWLARWALRTWPQFPKIRAGFFLQFSFKVSLWKGTFRAISRTADFGRLVALPFRC